MRKLIPLLGVALISACAGGIVTPIDQLRYGALSEVRSYSRNLEVFLNTTGTDSEAIEAAKSVITEKMRDPDSTNFKAVSIKRFEGKPLICGEVNSKNAYGGYVGYRKFVASHSEATIEDLSNSNSVNDAANAGIYSACSSQ